MRTTSYIFAVFIGLLGGTAQADMIIGVAAPMTGSNAAVGEQFKRGAEQAASDINAGGGIKGERVTLTFGDDASEPRQGISVANKFASDGVGFVVGHYNSGVSIPASSVYAENGMLQITPGSTNPTFTENGLWNTFRVCGRDDQQGAVAARHLLSRFKNKRIGIVDDKTAYGVGIAEEVRKNLHAAGVKEVFAEGITVGDKDFSVLISKMKAAKVDVFYFGGLYTEGGLIVRQAADQELKAVMLAGDGITSNQFGQIAGKAAVGTMMTFAPDPRLNPAANAVAQSFRAQGFEPEAYTLYAYAAVQVLKAGIELSDTFDPETVAETLKNNKKAITTVIGDIAFDKKGDRRDQDYTIYEWRVDPKGKVTYSMIDK